MGEPSLIDVIESEAKGQQSRTHIEFLASLGIKLGVGGGDLCGADVIRLELIHAVIE